MESTQHSNAIQCKTRLPLIGCTSTARSSSITNHPIQQDSDQSSLIPGLPDDISLFCLARVPRKYHAILNCVSKKWRDLVGSEEWRMYRQKHGLDETWLYALCRDNYHQLQCYVLNPEEMKKGWKQIRGFPSRYVKRKGVGFEVLGKKVYVLGGCGWIEDASTDVYCFDVSMNKWSQAASLCTPRCYFACEALDGKIYAIGGLGSQSSNPHSYDTYNPLTDSWTSHIDPNVVPEIESSFVLDGKIYIKCGSSAISSHVYAVVYDPSSGTWQHADTEFSSGWRGPAVVIDGAVYVLDQAFGIRMLKWEEGKREWHGSMSLSPQFMKPPCQVVAVEKKVLVIGKGLKTVSFDLDKATSVEGVLVVSSVKELKYLDEVISCKAISV